MASETTSLCHRLVRSADPADRGWRSCLRPLPCEEHAATQDPAPAAIQRALAGTGTALTRREQATAGLVKLASVLSDDQLATATDMLREILTGAVTVTVIGERVRDRQLDRNPSEPGYAEQVDRGIWNPAARSVYGLEPAHTGEANEFGEGASVQGFTEKERKAAYRTFLGVRAAVREMLDAPDPSAFFAKLTEAVGKIDPQGKVKLAAQIERFMSPALPAAEPEQEWLELPEGEQDGCAACADLGTVSGVSADGRGFETRLCDCAAGQAIAAQRDSTADLRQTCAACCEPFTPIPGRHRHVCESCAASIAPLARRPDE